MITYPNYLPRPHERWCSYVCTLCNKLVCYSMPLALTGMSMDKMQRQRKPWEWRIAGTNTPIRERDFFQLRLVPKHSVAESIHTLLHRPAAAPKITWNAGTKHSWRLCVVVVVCWFSCTPNHLYKCVIIPLATEETGSRRIDIEKEAEFGVAVKGESSGFYLSAFLEIVGQTRRLVGFGLLRILSWSTHCILIQMVRKTGLCLSHGAETIGSILVDVVF